ncbi:hypothetical protein CRM22_006671 [Opisthorchis felineus]|uniref:Bile salt export pump n=1 Tax=Opisthorchis felineus TaxID=147828 RepID=A0A4S2LJQ2_OPIFE|nr:hypothetical protein CRM22_006671 [Opisthorchis felineus]
MGSTEKSTDKVLDKTFIDENEEEFRHVTYFNLFRYATVGVKVIVCFGILLSVVVGILVTVNVALFRNIVNVLTVPPVSSDRARSTVVFFAVLGLIILVTSFIHALMLRYAAKQQLNRIRLLYFKALLRQEVSWIDRHPIGSLLVKLSHDTYLIEQGIGTKLGEFVQNVSSFISGIIASFALGWKLTLAACATLPFMVAAFTLFGVFTRYFAGKQLKAYARAGSIAHQALTAIRTVLAFGGEQKELHRYSEELESAKRVGIKRNTALGGITGAIGLTIYTSTGIILWYGVKLMIREHYDHGTIIMVFMNIIMGSMYLGNALPFLQHFVNAKNAARDIFGTIDRKPQIAKERESRTLTEFKGDIQFQNVSFAYPSRPDVPITIDGVDIRHLDLDHYREQIACVQQQPVLFEDTIAENIRMGQLSATQQMIEEAAKRANAHEFISNLPEGYQTVVGQQGEALSGGQKQRLAIARALIRNPKLLLLDEPTSSLDTISERDVQRALESASSGRTVLIVAHRLSTIRRADLIVVMEKGVICETGTHDELLAREGLYAAMFHEAVSSTGDESSLGFDHVSPEGVWKHKQDSEAASMSWNGEHTQEKSASSVSVILNTLRRNKWVLFRMLRLNLPEVWHTVSGCLFCMVAGAVQPAFAVVYSEIFGVFISDKDPTETTRRVNTMAWKMALIGIVRFIAMLAQGYFLGVAGENLVKRVRVKTFEAMMNQEMAWFDRPENQVGMLTTKLAEEVAKVRSVSGLQLGAFSEAIVLAVATLLASFIFNWQLTLTFLAFFPIIVLTGIFRLRNLAGSARDDRETQEIIIARESLENYRTTFTFNLGDYFQNLFKKKQDAERKEVNRGCALFAMVYGVTQSISMFAHAAIFGLGSYMLMNGTIAIIDVFRVFCIMNLGAQSLARTASFGALAIRASICARVILETIDRNSEIPTNEGLAPEVSFQGKLSFKRIYFRYPTRKTVSVLQNFNFTVEPGQTVALVGESGCGKSTLLQLIQRFYDPPDHGPDSGIFFDGYHARQLAPAWIRRQIGVVSQEPVLFDITLQDNIAYGDNSRTVPMEEIINAAKRANIHDFIISLPKGYQTMSGEQGTQLSGGQRQRIAIARALVRKPALLILDEATSALDAENERILQEALSSATDRPKTSLVVAHRLHTVENSDIVVVIDGGHVVEHGPPAALLAAKGAFYALYAAEKHTSELD